MNSFFLMYKINNYKSELNQFIIPNMNETYSEILCETIREKFKSECEFATTRQLNEDELTNGLTKGCLITIKGKPGVPATNLFKQGLEALIAQTNILLNFS